MGRRGFVGRAAELDRLDRALRAAATDGGGTVLVAGEAGIGKTRLVTELAAHARAAGATVLSGRCIDLVGAGVPYLALADALRSVPGSPLLTDQPADSGPRPRAQLFLRVRAVLEQAAAEAPLVLVVEDVHWADASTLDLLSFLAHGVAESRILLAVTYRSDEAIRHDGLARLVNSLRQARKAELVELGPMHHDDLLTLLAAASAQPLPSELADAISTRCGGNPFFAEELLDAAGRGEENLPRLVRDALLQRIARLGAGSRAVIQVASVAGRNVSYPLLTAVTRLPADALQQALREAVDHHVLTVDQAGDTFRFRHALFGEAVYAMLLPGEREDLHAAFATALDESTDPDPGDARAGELAQHWAAAGHPTEAFTASLRAARHAESAAGLAEALAHLERVLELWDRVPAVEKLAGAPLADVLARTAEHADDTGRPQRAAELVRRAIARLDESAEPVRVALLYERLGSYLFPVGDRLAGIAACRRAVDLVPAQPPTPERVRVLSAYAHALMLSWRFTDARAVCEEAIAAASALGDPTRAFRAVDVLGHCLCYLGRPDEGLPLLHEACRRPAERSAPERLTRPYVFYSDALLLTGRLDDAARVARRGLEFVREIGQEPSVGNVLAANIAEALLGTGDWAGAADTISAALRTGGDYWSHHLHVWQAQLATGRGEFGTAHGHLDAGARAIREPSAAPYHACVAADLALWEGRPAVAARAVESGLHSTAATGAAFLTVRLCAIGLRAHGDDADGPTDRRRADDLLVLAREAAGAAAAVTPDAAAWSTLAAAEHSRLDGSDPRLWSRAADTWVHCGRPYLAAYSHWRHAEAIVASGARPADATPAARAAHDTATRLGAQPLRREVEHLARRARLHLTPQPAPPVPQPAGQWGLTAREAEILQLLALGYTNRDIATELTISVKTASVHVSHILHKLNVSSRIQAAAFARRLPPRPT